MKSDPFEQFSSKDMTKLAFDSTRIVHTVVELPFTYLRVVELSTFASLYVEPATAVVTNTIDIISIIQIRYWLLRCTALLILTAEYEI